MKSRTLRVGFDLDGVILYNPARIVRPLISLIKRSLLHKKRLKFYYPQSPLEKNLWRLFHRSSIYLAPGIEDIEKLVKQKKIKAYIVTARFAFLGPELMQWIEKKHLGRIFEKVYFNEKDEQPHFFKERMVRELKLDVFVEDNFDIVTHLNKKSGVKVFWIYNIFDFFLKYKMKFPHLREAIRSII